MDDDDDDVDRRTGGRDEDEEMLDSDEDDEAPRPSWVRGTARTDATPVRSADARA